VVGSNFDLALRYARDGLVGCLQRGLLMMGSNVDAALRRTRDGPVGGLKKDLPMMGQVL